MFPDPKPQPDATAGQMPAMAWMAPHLKKVRHDLQNVVGQILGFSEVLLEELPASGSEHVRTRLERVHLLANQISARINEGLAPSRIEAGLTDLPDLQTQTCQLSADIVTAMEDVISGTRDPTDAALQSDLARIAAAAREICACARTALLQPPAPPGTDAPAEAASTPLAPVTQATSETLAPVRHGQDTILVVEDLEENRELLLRLLSRLGYSVAFAHDGQAALAGIAKGRPDLVLMDIIMPGMDGVTVLKRLKSDAATRHIPVIMLSSADEIDTVVNCIQLGADDFIPKPFNATLLAARIESSLAKKRLHDQEEAFLKRIQAERKVSERLLLNILPRPIAERLKSGQKIIADSFSEVTVLFSDFVGFTRRSAGMPPDVLVGMLNRIFSTFDDLCEQHGLEKIKMIGDAYMAVAGLPRPRREHAHAAAALALDMQAATSRFSAETSQRWRMRVGLNTGPVIAGVIGKSKFAYDLWGDTVNLASRMESHAPTGGILVTAATYELLRNEYAFDPGTVIRVKGQGEVLAYLLRDKLS
jgi:adenylate cyclase